MDDEPGPRTRLLLSATRLWLPLGIALAGTVAIVLGRGHTELAAAGVVLLGSAVSPRALEQRRCPRPRSSAGSLRLWKAWQPRLRGPGSRSTPQRSPSRAPRWMPARRSSMT